MPTKLGQNFLKNDAIVAKIVAAADLKPDDLVLEIGPGKGILTEELAKKAGKVVAVEIDKNLGGLLKGKFKGQQNVEIIEGDILKLDLDKLISNYKVVANLPYYITSPIIRLFLESVMPPTEMILMVQKEVAERIVASAGQMSILAISVQYYADAEILFEVGKENFDPVPKVNSAIVKIAPHSSSPYQGRGIKGEGGDAKTFFRIVKAGFSAKRKTLVNNLSNSLHLDKSMVEEKLKTAGLLPTVRAQELSIENWKKMAGLF
jgi:16S rRNA (adenine1518-N6/adenine1519-N6)-dimethyltransferase